MKTLKTTIQTIQKQCQLTNNTQRVGVKLLSAGGAWLPRSSLTRIPSATARIRDLRKQEFGSFNVECQSSDELKRSGKRTFYYRINPSQVTQKQIDALFPQAE